MTVIIYRSFNSTGEVKNVDDIKLAMGLRNKKEKALEEIILKYTPLVAAIIYNVGKGNLSKEDIEEVTSDVFMTLWKNSDKVLPDKLKGYICCIARTRALNKLSGLKNNNVISLEEWNPEDNFSIDDHTEKQELKNELKTIIDEIGEPDKEIMIRYYMYYQKTSKISEVMKLNLETVKSKLRRTREKIRSKLMERGYDV